MLIEFFFFSCSQLAIKQKEECLELLGKVLPEEENAIIAFSRRYERDNEDSDDAVGINIVSALALLMGETFEAVGNRENAAVYFRIALRCDVYNSEVSEHNPYSRVTRGIPGLPCLTICLLWLLRSCRRSSSCSTSRCFLRKKRKDWLHRSTSQRTKWDCCVCCIRPTSERYTFAS